MNKQQATVLALAATAIGVTMLFPPWGYETPVGQGFEGYYWIFEKPQGGRVYSINPMLLLVEWIAILVIGGFLWVLLRKETPSIFPLGPTTTLSTASRRDTKSTIRDARSTASPRPNASSGPNQGPSISEKTEAPVALSKADLDDFYRKAWEETESGSYEKGLWARIFVEADGDKTKANLRYIKERVQQLSDEEIARSAEQERRAVELARQQHEQELREKHEREEPIRQSHGGLCISRIESGSAAERAGLKEGDIVVSYAGQSVRCDKKLFANLMADAGDGEQREVVIVRDGKFAVIACPSGDLGLSVAELA